MNWKTLEFDQCTVRELYLIMRARSAVFVVEQSHPCLDADGHDEGALHIFAAEDMARPMPVVAYARVRPGSAHDPRVVLDKVLTSPARRGDGTAEALIERALWAAAERWPGSVVRVSAPVGQCAFYEQCGFRRMERLFAERGARTVDLVCRTRRGGTMAARQNVMAEVIG